MLHLRKKFSRVEAKVFKLEHEAFTTWKDSLSWEQFQAFNFQVCSELAQAGVIPSPPEAFWSLSEEEQSEYYNHLWVFMNSSEWEDIGVPIVRSIWLTSLEAG